MLLNTGRVMTAAMKLLPWLVTVDQQADQSEMCLEKHNDNRMDGGKISPFFSDIKYSMISLCSRFSCNMGPLYRSAYWPPGGGTAYSPVCAITVSECNAGRLWDSLIYVFIVPPPPLNIEYCEQQSTSLFVTWTMKSKVENKHTQHQIQLVRREHTRVLQPTKLAVPLVAERHCSTLTHPAETVTEIVPDNTRYKERHPLATV